MAHKSHRHKALQSQLEPRPEISLAPVQPKAGPSTSHDTSMDVDDDDDDTILIPTSSTSTSVLPCISAAPDALPSSSGFTPLPASSTNTVLKNEFRRIPIPPHRMAPLKREWVNLYTPMVEMLGLQVRMNVKRRAVEIKVSVSECLYEESC
jgi:RNA-binding protein PNO1